MREFLVDPETLPTPPGVVLEIIRRADEPDVSIPELAELVERDAAMTARFVQMANSSLFSPKHEINSVQRALMVVGLRSVRLLALSASLRSLLPSDETANASAEARRRSVINAIAARRFISMIDPAGADDAFLAGLLGHMGTIVVATQESDRYLDLAAAAGGWMKPADQQAGFGFRFDYLTAALVDDWGLPPRIGTGLRHRSEPLSEPIIPLIAALQIGSLVEDVLVASDGLAASQLFELADRVFNLDRPEVEQILLDMEADVIATARLLTFEIPAGSSHSALLAEATLRMEAFSVETMAALKQEASAVEQLQERNDQLEDLNKRDALTGLFNRGAFDGLIEDEILRRRVAPNMDLLGLLIFDVDHFKKVNDVHGHPVGDQVLVAVAKAVETASRRGEYVARYGGEEFTLLMPRTEVREMELAAERMRRTVEDLVIDTPNGPLSVTISVGGAALRDSATVDQAALRLLERADAQLYTAKHDGRNCSKVDTRIL